MKWYITDFQRDCNYNSQGTTTTATKGRKRQTKFFFSISKVLESSILLGDRLKEWWKKVYMFVLTPTGSVCFRPRAMKTPKCSDWAPLFMKTYEMHNAGAVILLMGWNHVSLQSSIR